MKSIFQRSRLIHSKTAATRLLPIERAFKTAILAISTVYQEQYSKPIAEKATHLCVISLGFDSFDSLEKKC